ncbi:ABC transporter permease/M1 family aminopeptidase [Sphingomicrobium sediminis]|uniref:Aminopeptidase n=1 Tax=Sphingomicrobium sediminis TaxID=2950949 RepID=A0A9X2EJ84_9SPHN|nr:M1 family aminopeptidase [Sphingomicrobium sediminis]MCM8556624.1 aminopeptidase [Sphingomicrobium sediminis]
MIGKIAAFELRYHLKSPTFWVGTFIFFLLGFGLTASDNVQINSGGAIHENSPWSLSVLMGVATVFYLMIVTAFVANAIIRDDATKFAPMIRATPVTERQMVFGRFLGGFGIAALGFLIVPFGAFMGTLMPWVDPELVGPQRAEYYLWPYLVLSLPNIFLASALLFMLATVTRSMMWSYVGVVLFVVVYLVITSIASANPDLRPIFARFEPLGVGAFNEITRYWTNFEQNTRLLPLEGTLLFNRLFGIAMGFVFLAITLWRFSFAERPASKRKLRKLAKAKEREKMLAAVPPTLGGEAISTAGRKPNALSQFIERTQIEIRQMVRSPGLIVLLLVAVGFAASDLWAGQAIYGADSYATVSAVISSVRDQFYTFIIIIAAFYGGEAVWRERDHKMNEIVDSAPVPAWAMTVPKILAIFLVIVAINATGMITGLFYQLTKGAEEFGVASYISWFIIPAAVDAALIAVLAVVVQVLSPNKYVGWGILLAWFLGTIVMSNLGYTNPLYIYGAGPGVPLSDMVDPAPFQYGARIMQAYWAAIAVLLALAAHLLWPRGTDLALRSRFKRLRHSGASRGVLAIGLVALVSAVGLGVYTHHNIKELNTYRTGDEAEVMAAEYERKYLQYEDVIQPIVTDVKLDADLFPDERKLEVEGSYQLLNNSDAPIELLYIREGSQDLEYEAIELAGATLETHDETYGVRTYRFDTPMQPGETRELSFNSLLWYQGFRSGGPATGITPDATFVNSQAFTPMIGMDRSGMLTDRQARRRQGLSDELRPPKLEDMDATRKNALSMDWVNADITLSTDADQVPIAPGNKVSDEIVDDRRVARFVSPAPILQFFSLQSGHYEVATRDVDGIEVSVYYHEKHPWNVERMLDAAEASLTYFEENFGPYQFDHARIIEFPGYATFAQAYAGTMPYSEAIGFTAKVNEDDTDFITYVIAHELAHQYWAHQVIGAGMQGDALTTETMASYSAIMVMKSLLGEDQMRRFLKHELDRYLSGRKGETIEELPLIRMENQQYIHYRKGGHVMALLAHRLGEERVNRAFANFIEKWRFKGAPYHRSLDFVAEVRAVAETEEEQALITDIFEKIVLFDLKVENATTEQVGDKWRTTIEVSAAKFEADGQGKETEVALTDPVEIGLFSARPGFDKFDSDDVVLLETRSLEAGTTTIILESDEKPDYAGIDPYNRYVDRISEDNLESVSES